MTKTWPSSARQIRQQPALTSSAPLYCLAMARSSASIASRRTLTMSTGGGTGRPAASKRALPCWRRIRETSDHRLATRPRRAASSAAARYRARLSSTTSAERRLPASRATRAGSALTVAAKRSHSERSDAHRSSSAARWRSRSKISTASTVRRTDRPSMRRTTIGRRQLGHRRLRMGGGSIATAQYGHLCTGSSTGRGGASASGGSAGSTGTSSASRSSTTVRAPGRRKTRSKNPNRRSPPITVPVSASVLRGPAPGHAGKASDTWRCRGRR